MIDKHCIKVTQSNYPNTIQIGDVKNDEMIDQIANQNKMFTYIMSMKTTNDCDKLYKIGKTKNVEQRLKALKTGSPHIYIVCFGRGISEGKLHQKFADKRVRGEWFRLTLSDIKEATLLISGEYLTDSRPHHPALAPTIQPPPPPSNFVPVVLLVWLVITVIILIVVANLSPFLLIPFLDYNVSMEGWWL